jgi:hypothetical protein
VPNPADYPKDEVFNAASFWSGFCFKVITEVFGFK